MTVNVSAMSNILKDNWLPMVQNDINLKANLYKYFRKSSEPFQVGNNWYIRFKTSTSPSFGWTSDGGNLPAKANAAWNRFTITPKLAYSQFDITGLGMSQGRTNPNSMKDILMATKEDTTDSCIKKMNQALYGDGTGELGFVTAVSANVSLTFAGTGTGADKRWQGRYLNGNETIAIHDQSNNWAVLGTTTATAMNHSSDLLNVPATSGAAAQDSVCYALQGTNQSSRNNAIWGLEYHVDDSSNITTYQGLTRADVDRAKANVIANGGSNRPLTLTLMEQAAIQRCVSSDAMDSDEMLIMMDIGMRQQYIELLQGQVRYIPMKLEGGTKKEGDEQRAIAYNNTPIHVDTDCTYTTIYFLTPGDFAYHVLDDWQFEDRDGAVLKMTGGATNTHTFYAMLYTFCNLSCRRPKAQTKLSDVTQTIITA